MRAYKPLAKYTKDLGAFKGVIQLNNIPNQFVIFFENGEVFQSYTKVIAIRFYKGLHKIILGKHYKYSSTTSKYRNIFLDTTSKEVEKRIKEGTYIVDEDIN